MHALHLRKANLEWEIPDPIPAERPHRRAQLAAPMSSDADQEFTSSTESLDSDDLPLARMRERLLLETSDRSNSNDSENIPLAQLNPVT